MFDHAFCQVCILNHVRALGATFPTCYLRNGNASNGHPFDSEVWGFRDKEELCNHLINLFVVGAQNGRGECFYPATTAQWVVVVVVAAAVV